MRRSGFDMVALRQQFADDEAAMPADIRDAHQFSSEHRAAIEEAGRCGCFYCLSTFAPSEIGRWYEKDTALCPRCGIDSVLPDNVGISLDREFLTQMQFHWFKGSLWQSKS
jgi:hypothetical protein